MISASFSPGPRPEDAFCDVYDACVIDASFLWILRTATFQQAHYNEKDIASLERRIQAYLDGLMTCVDSGWKACEEALALEEPGEVFVAAVVAFNSRDDAKIESAINAGLINALTFKGLVSALGWLAPGQVLPWIEKFLNSKVLNRKYLGLAACSVRRYDPGDILNDILQQDNCLQHQKLHARALRLIGELRRQDLMFAIEQATVSDDHDLLFWANWSAILAGRREAVNHLKPYVLGAGPHQHRAIQMAFRVLPIEQAKQWIDVMTKDKTPHKMAIKAIAALGDPQEVDSLIAQMAVPSLSRLAGEAFTTLTGIELKENRLTQAAPSKANNAQEDDNLGLEEDEKLLWPDVEKVTRCWRQHRHHFVVGQRYFRGQPISCPWLRDQRAQARNMRHHHVMAILLEQALADPGQRFHNAQARVTDRA